MSTAVLFLTGMASNAVIASTIKDIAGVELTWMLWFKAALVPGLIVLFLCPLVVYKLYPPQMKDLGDIKPFVVSKMQEMGAMKKDEKILLALFIMAILGWMLGGKIGISMYVVAFAFLALELLLGVMDWNDLMAEKGAWNMYIWYGAFFSISGAINEGGFYSWLSGQIQNYLDLSAVNGMAVLVILLLISFVTKYFFVSNAAYIASIYPVILTLAASTNVNIMALSLMLAFSADMARFCATTETVQVSIFWKWLCEPERLVSERNHFISYDFAVFLIIGLPYWKIMGIC